MDPTTTVSSSFAYNENAIFNSSLGLYYTKNEKQFPTRLQYTGSRVDGLGQGLGLTKG